MCLAGPHTPKLSFSAYQISCEFGMELYFVFMGSFSTIKNKRFPSADTVGLSSAKGVLIFGPKFSVLMIVDAVIMFSFCGIRLPEVSASGWAFENCPQTVKRKNRIGLFTTLDLPAKII